MTTARLPNSLKIDDFLLSLSEACNYTSPNSGVKISLETFATVQVRATAIGHFRTI
jgi:hypothetical protein